MDDFDFLEKGSTAPKSYVLPTSAPALSPERLGKITASMASVVMGSDKLTLEKYIKALAWERVFGSRDLGFQSKMMDRGLKMEPRALEWYAKATGLLVDFGPGFKIHKGLPFVGASPDGVAFPQDGRGRKRTVQAKCPGSDAWMDFLMQREPGPYAWQCRWEAWVCGYKSSDLLIWHPEPGGLIIPVVLEKEHVALMVDRALMVEDRVVKWIEELRKPIK